MDGPGHYREAELLLTEVELDEYDHTDPLRLAHAQVHATLALAAATALRPADLVHEDEPLVRGWLHVAGGEPA